jgi:hypothetical protein
MDKDQSPIRSASFEEALSNAIRLAELAEEDDSDAGRRQATAQLATAWGTIAQALASKYAVPFP